MIKKIKKVFICTTKSNLDSTQKYIFDISRELSKNRDVRLSIILDENSELKNRLKEININIIDIKNSQKNFYAFKYIKLFFELLKIFKKEKPDVIHLISSETGFVGGLAGKISSIKKIIFTIHKLSFNEDNNFLEKIIIKILYIFIISFSHKTIVTSEITKKQIEKYFSKKIIVIKNGIPDINFMDKKSARESLSIKILQKNSNVVDKLTSDPVWVGTISKLDKNKGLKYAIEAISKIKENIIFIIIGDGEEKRILEELSIKLGSSNKIFLIGRIKNASQYLKAFDIFTITSTIDTLPYTILEAGKAEVPVITSNTGGIPEIIESDISGILIPTKNSEQIKDSILKLIKNTKKTKDLSHNLIKKINKEFKEDNMLKKTFEVYNI